ncbi:MAG TPA: helix-turn-helix transcriptional regulator [Micromonosporaceae bacterium]
MRDLRDTAGLTLRDAGDHIMRDPSTISRIEAGTLPARLPDVMELLNLYGVDDLTVRAGLEQFTRDVWRKGWWDGYTEIVPDKIIDAAWLEARATNIRHFSTLVLPGLVQTPEYAEAVIRAAGPETSDEQLQQWVTFRMKRQEVLTGEDAPDYQVILDESALQRVVGGPVVMREQLARLLDVSRRPNVTVRVLPFSTGPLSSPDGGFTVFAMPNPFPLVAQINSEGGALYLEMPTAGRFNQAYTRLEGEALDVEDSQTFLKTRMEQFA